MTTGALEGIRVLEYGSLLGAPYCGKLLADLGAEVIKIERPALGDDARRRGPFPNDVPHPEKSALFLYSNTNKKGVTLNLAHPAGQAMFRKLVVDAHVFIEDTQPGTLKEYDLEYAAFRKLNPDLAMTSVTPFGQRGPYGQYKAYPLNIAHSTGEASSIPAGQPFDATRPPIRIGQSVASLDGGLSAAIATLASLFARLLQGEGTHIDISLQEQGMAFVRRELASHFWENWDESRKERGARPGSLIQCKDGYVMLFLLHQHHFRDMMAVLGDPSWASEERFSTPEKRVKDAPALNSLVSAWARTTSPSVSSGRESISHRCLRRSVSAARRSFLRCVACEGRSLPKVIVSPTRVVNDQPKCKRAACARGLAFDHKGRQRGVPPQSRRAPSIRALHAAPVGSASRRGLPVARLARARRTAVASSAPSKQQQND